MNSNSAESPISLRAAAEVHVVTPPSLLDLWRNLFALYQYFALFRVLVWRFVVIRYLQSVLGIVWVALQPVGTTAVILFMFGIVKVSPGDGANNGLFLLAGLVTWQFFSRALQDATGSLTGNSGILTKIYLPKLIFPLAAATAACLDLAVMLVILLASVLLFGNGVTERIVFLPVFVALVLLFGFALGTMLSPINALYRDVGFLLGFGLQFWMYLTPVLYSARFVPEQYKSQYYLNPMATLVEGIRWSLLVDSPPPAFVFLAINIFTIVFVLIAALLIFQKLESDVVDRI